MKLLRLFAITAAAIALAAPATALAGAEGPGTPQATASNTTFLSAQPAPATGRGVCVIDTGVDTDTDLNGALGTRVAQIGGVVGDPSDTGAIGDTGDALPKHGTYVSGIVASQVDGVGTSGIWPAAKVYSNRVFAGGGTAVVTDYIRAIDWCHHQTGVKVINLSLSGLGGASLLQRQALNDKVNEVRDSPYNINVVAAAGNNGSPTVGYPALAGGVFAVGATDGSGALASFSNRGTGLDIATFGVGSCVTTNQGTHLSKGAGTSYAAPIVSAVLAAMRSYDPTLTPDQAEALLLDSADTVAGIKVLNGARAFRSDPALAALAFGAPTTGLGAAVANPCVAPPEVVAVGGDASPVVETTTQQVTAMPSQQTIAVTPNPVPAPMVDVQVPTDYPVSALRPVQPMLRSVKYRRGVLSLHIEGYKSGERAVFRVTYRVESRTRTTTFTRDSGTLKVRVPNWTSVRVQLVRPGVGSSKALTVRPNGEY
jgi:serine protease